MTGYDKNTIPRPSNTTVKVEFLMYVLCAEIDTVTGLLKTSTFKQMVRMSADHLSTIFVGLIVSRVLYICIASLGSVCLSWSVWQD